MVKKTAADLQVILCFSDTFAVGQAVRPWTSFRFESEDQRMGETGAEPFHGFQRPLDIRNSDLAVGVFCSGIFVGFQQVRHGAAEHCEPAPGTVGPLAGKTFVITGTLPTMSREVATEKIEAAGGSLTQVSGELNGGFLGGTGDYRKVDVEGRWYAPLGTLGGGDQFGGGVQFVLGFTAKSGFIFGDASHAISTPANDASASAGIASSSSLSRTRTSATCVAPVEYRNTSRCRPAIHQWSWSSSQLPSDHRTTTSATVLSPACRNGVRSNSWGRRESLPMPTASPLQKT